MADEEGEQKYCGPYKIRLFEPWINFGTEGMTDLDGLYQDISRWRALILDGRGEVAAHEMREVLIQFDNYKSPFARMVEHNTRVIEAIKR